MNLGRTRLYTQHTCKSFSDSGLIHREDVHGGFYPTWLAGGWGPRGLLQLLDFCPAPPVPGALRDHLCLPWLSSWDTAQGQGLAFVSSKWRHTQVPPQWLPGLSFLLEPVQLQRKAVWVQKAGLSTRGLVSLGRAHRLPALSSVYF